VTRLAAHARRLPRARSGAAAVEFALVVPALLAVATGALDLGYAFYVRLRVADATTAAVLYAQLNGPKVTAAEVPAFIATVRAVAAATAALPQPPDVSVLFNNAPDASRFATYFCLSGFPPAWAPVGASALSCGGSVTGGKFVSVTVTANRPTLFVRSGLFGALSQTSDRAVARIE